MNKKKLLYIGGGILFLIIIIGLFSNDNSISSLDLVEKSCPVGEGYTLQEDFDIPIYNNITPKEFFDTTYDVVKNGEWCQLLVEGVPEAIAYECSYEKFEYASTNGYGTDGTYSYACRGVFEPSLITGRYYNKDKGVYEGIYAGKLVEFENRNYDSELEKL